MYAYEDPLFPQFNKEEDTGVINVTYQFTAVYTVSQALFLKDHLQCNEEETTDGGDMND